jgi:hypothetical protein
MTKFLMFAAAGLVLAAFPAAAGQSATPAAGPAGAASGAGDVPAGTCDAAAAEFAIGQPYTEDLGAEAQVAAGARSLRVIPEGMNVTMDFLPDRLNIDLDGSNVVVMVRCG